MDQKMPPLPPLPPIPGHVTDDQQKPRLTGLRCASCGGSLEIESGLTNIVCRYCQTPQAILGRRGIRSMMVLDRHQSPEAENVLRKWLRTGIRKHPALRRESRIEESFLAFFPFLRSEFDILGVVLGFDTKKKKRGKNWVTVRVPVERHIEKHIDRTLAAAHMAEFGVRQVNLTGDEILPLDEELLQKRGMIFRPNRSAEESAAELEAAALLEVQAQSQAEHTSFSWLTTLRRRRQLIYYPLWVFRYSFRGRRYQALIDAEDAHLAYGKAPGNDLWRAFALISSCAAATFLGTSILQHLNILFRSQNSLPLIGILGIVLAGIVGWGYSQFRQGGVVEEGDGIIRRKKASPIDLEQLKKFGLG